MNRDEADTGDGILFPVSQGEIASSDPAGAPDWNTIQREILCPLCGYNLRGLVEPRCPECGHRSVWEVLLAEELAHPYLFEHQRGQYVRSWWRTMCTSACWPGTFWRELQPMHRVRFSRLFHYWFILAIAGVVAMLALVPLQALDAQIRENRNRQIARLYLGQHPQEAVALINQYGSIEAYLVLLYPPPAIWRLIGNHLEDMELLADWAKLALFVTLAWPAGTFVSLLLFRATMARARIRNGHVLRCVIYSADPISLPAVGALICMLLWTLGANWPIPLPPPYALAGLVMLLMIYRLTRAYRLYLAFPHAIAAVLASQVIVLLVIWKTSLTLAGY